VKSNIGHLDAAAGIASLIKAVLCAEKGYLVPSINYSVPNPVLELETSPFYVIDNYKEWPEEFEVRRAAVSSLGVGGTNVHVIIEEPPKKVVAKSDNQLNIVTVSAATQEGLDQQKKSLAQFLNESNSEFSMDDLEFTTLYGRKMMPFRFSAIGSAKEELAQQLSDNQPDNTFLGGNVEKRESIFMFPGQGSQYRKMGLDLYQNDEDFRKDMDASFEYLKATFDYDLKSIIFSEDKELLNRTENTQPALFAIEYCLAKDLMRSGIQPKGFIGHSLGEFVAAALAGCFSLEDALKMVYHRGRLMGSMEEGAMLLVRYTEEKLRPLLIDSVSICVYNADDNIVLGGSMEDIDQQKALLEINNIECKILRVSHAYHTPMMEPVLDELEKIIETVSFENFNLPIFSTYTGERVAPEMLCSVDYWLKQIISPVQFTGAFRSALNELGNPVFVEVGPGNGLSSFARVIDSTADTVSLLAKSSDTENDKLKILKAKAQLFVKGINFNLPAHHNGHRIPLPTYIFDKKYFWKPKTNVRFDKFENISEGYHYNNEEFSGDVLRTKIEIQLSNKKKISENLLKDLDKLQDQYLNSIQALLNDSGQVKNSVEALYEKVNRNQSNGYGQNIGNNNQTRNLSNPFVAPETEMEKLIAGHWETILGYQPAGVLDDFFDAGGNSLLATQLINRINQELNINIAIADILSSSNIKTLIQIIEEKQWLEQSDKKANEIII